MTEVFKVDPLNPDIRVIEKCAEILRSGGLVAFPTETVYGLGASVFNPQAVRKVFEIKERPFGNPLIVHISGLEQFSSVVAEVPEQAWRLIKAMWPGPLTLVLRKSHRVPDIVTGGLPKVGVRMPAHPVAIKLIELTSVPLVAPSANLSGRSSPTTAEHVIQDLYGRVDAIIDTGETLLGIESTVVDLTTTPPILIRAGPVLVETLESMLNTKVKVPAHARGLRQEDREVPRSKYTHYKPGTPLVLVEMNNYSNLLRLAKEVSKVAQHYLNKGYRVGVIASKETQHYYSRLSRVKLITIGSRKKLYEVAKNVFKVLRSLNSLNIDVAICEGFDERGLGLAIMSRLREASRQNIIKVG